MVSPAGSLLPRRIWRMCSPASAGVFVPPQGPLLGRPPSCVDKILNRDISHGGSILFGKFLHACNGLAAFFECLASVILFTPSLHALQNQLVDGPEVAVADFLLNQAFGFRFESNAHNRKLSKGSRAVKVCSEGTG
jgi:hypothetical protein